MSGRLRRRLDQAGHDGQATCSRCGGTGVEPAAVGAVSPEEQGRQTAAAALAEARRKIERQREVRAALEPGVVDVAYQDERPPRPDDNARANAG
jgi:hypothetical protein